MNSPQPLIPYIKTIFPSDWLSNAYADDYEEGIDIIHPLNDKIYLTVVSLPKVMGIGLLKHSERDILIDLSGFDYSFATHEFEQAKSFLASFRNLGYVVV